MKNHKINYKKYISLATVLAMTLIGVAISPDLVNNTKYEVTDTNRTTEEQVVTLPEEQVEEVQKVEVPPSEPAPNVKAQAAVAIEKENPFTSDKFKEYHIQYKSDRKQIIETGETTSANGKEVFYAWTLNWNGIDNDEDGDIPNTTEVSLELVAKDSYETIDDLNKWFEPGQDNPLYNGLDKGDKVTLAYPQERLNNSRLPLDILDKYFLPTITAQAYLHSDMVTMNSDHTITLEMSTTNNTHTPTFSLDGFGPSRIIFFEKKDDGKWYQITNSTIHQDTKEYKEDINLEEDLEYKAILYLNTNAWHLGGTDSWEDFPDSWKGDPEETLPNSLEDFYNLKGTVIDITDDVEVVSVNNEQPQYSFGETVTLAIKNTLGHDIKDIKIVGRTTIQVEVGYLGPKPETPEPETGVSTPELAAEPLKLPLENRDFKGLEELIYEAHDSKDGNLNSKVKIKSGAVNLAKVGKYTLVLEVTNSDGVTAEEQVVIEVFENEIEPKPETPGQPEDTETEIEDPKGPDPTETETEIPEITEPTEPETPDVEVPEKATPDVEKPTEATPNVEPEKVKVVEKVEVSNTPKAELVKESGTAKEQADKATTDVDKKAGPDKLLQTDIKTLHPALSLIGGIALVAAGLYFFKKSYLVFKTSLKNSKK